MRDLVRHQGEVHRWATAIVRDSSPRPDCPPPAWPDDDEFVPWFRTGAPRSPTSSSTRIRPWIASRSFPRRRRLCSGRDGRHTRPESIASMPQSAVGPITPFDVDLAVDGIEEMLFGFASRISQPLAGTVAAIAGTASHRRGSGLGRHGSAPRPSTCRAATATAATALRGQGRRVRAVHVAVEPRRSREQVDGDRGQRASSISGRRRCRSPGPEARRSQGSSERCRRDDARARGGERLKRLRRSAEWRLGGCAVRGEPAAHDRMVGPRRRARPAARRRSRSRWASWSSAVAARRLAGAPARPPSVCTFIAMQSLGPVHDALSANLGAAGVVMAARPPAARLCRTSRARPPRAA